MFAIGASRALIANLRWWKAGLEMLGLGAIVAAIAYGSGAIVAGWWIACEHQRADQPRILVGRQRQRSGAS